MSPPSMDIKEGEIDLKREKNRCKKVDGGRFFVKNPKNID